MSWYTSHILTIITFLPLVGAVVIALLGRERASIGPLGRAHLLRCSPF